MTTNYYFDKFKSKIYNDNTFTLGNKKEGYLEFDNYTDSDVIKGTSRAVLYKKISSGNYKALVSGFCPDMDSANFNISVSYGGIDNALSSGTGIISEALHSLSQRMAGSQSIFNQAAAGISNVGTLGKVGGIKLGNGKSAEKNIKDLQIQFNQTAKKLGVDVESFARGSVKTSSSIIQKYTGTDADINLPTMTCLFISDSPDINNPNTKLITDQIADLIDLFYNRDSVKYYFGTLWTNSPASFDTATVIKSNADHRKDYKNTLILETRSRIYELLVLKNINVSFTQSEVMVKNRVRRVPLAGIVKLTFDYAEKPSVDDLKKGIRSL